MKLTRWVYFTMMAVCYVAGMYTGLRIYYIVFAAQLIAIVAVLLINLWTVYAFKYKQELLRKVCVKGEETVLHVEIKNERPVPLSLMEVHVDVVSQSERVNLVFGLAPFSGKEFKIPIAMPYRGSFSVGMTTIKVTDIFGLITFRFDMRRLSYYHMAQLLVLPKAEALGAVAANMVDAKLYSNTYLKQAEQGDSVSGARLYRGGDELKRVHWKKSAQQGALYVKQYEHPERERILLLIDTSAHKLTGEAALIYADTVCECAASIALHSLMRNRVVRVITSEGSIAQGTQSMHGTSNAPAEYTSPSDIEKLQRHLAQLTFDGGDALRGALERACSSLESARALFVLTREATPALTEVLERSLSQYNSMTLVLVGGTKAGGRVHTLYVEAGCNAAECLDGIG